MIDFRFVRHFWYFSAVAEELSFSRAARRLGMSQPPLSQQIKMLEIEMGVELFTRGSDGVQLTDAGRRALVSVNRFSEQARGLAEVVIAARKRLAPELSIVAINSAISDVVPYFLLALQEQRPNTKISVAEKNSEECLRAVRLSEVDVALGRFPKTVPGLQIVDVLYDELVVVMNIGHKLFAESSIDIRDLAHESFVLFPRRISPFYFDELMNHCLVAGFIPMIESEITSVVSQIALVGCTDCISFVPKRATRYCTPATTFRGLKQPIFVRTCTAAFDQKRLGDHTSALLRRSLQHSADSIGGAV